MRCCRRLFESFEQRVCGRGIHSMSVVNNENSRLRLERAKIRLFLQIANGFDKNISSVWNDLADVRMFAENHLFMCVFIVSGRKFEDFKPDARGTFSATLMLNRVVTNNSLCQLQGELFLPHALWAGEQHRVGHTAV